MSEEPGGKRVSWVELYFDLVFVFAVSQTTHIMVTSPDWGGLGRALGLFVPLWRTWTGFAVLYNRHGEDRISQRLFVLAGTLPCAVAAIETRSAADGHAMAFTFALAGARLILGLAFASASGQARQVAIGYGLSASAFTASAFTASAFVPGPWRYGIWAVALIQEAGFLLLRDGERGAERPPHRSRTEVVRDLFKPPVDPARRVDAAHLAERFGLMMIILLGEIVVAVAAPTVEMPAHDLRYWLGLLAGLVLAADPLSYFGSAPPNAAARD